MRRRLALLALAALAASATTGCTVGPDFHPPAVASPAEWGAEPGGVGSATTSGPVDPAWWNSFGDRELSSLVSRLVSQNIDLQTAVERIRQAADETDVARSQGLPQVNGNSSYTHERQSPNGFIALVQPSPAASYDYDIWTNGLSASWELDLFGRVRRAVEARRAGTVAAVEARHAVALASISTLAQDYLQLRGTQARLRIAQRNLVVTQKNMSLVDVQFANGVGTTLAVAQARAEVATVAATMPPLVTTAAALENAIALLLAEPPRALEAELDAPAPAAIVPPTVPIGLPADLIRRRPDVREAEATLHEATAETGVALADFYPDVSLTGNFELQGRNVLNAFSLPDRAFVAGPAIDLPIFEGGRLRATLRLRRSQQREAADDFRNTVLQAWGDVDNALTAYAQGQRQRGLTAEEVRDDQVALDAARESYSQGASDFLNVDAAENALLEAEDALAVADTAIATDLVGLYKALGGGWQVADPPQVENAASTLAAGSDCSARQPKQVSSELGMTEANGSCKS